MLGWTSTGFLSCKTGCLVKPTKQSAKQQANHGIIVCMVVVICACLCCLCYAVIIVRMAVADSQARLLRYDADVKIPKALPCRHTFCSRVVYTHLHELLQSEKLIDVWLKKKFGLVGKKGSRTGLRLRHKHTCTNCCNLKR